MILYEIWLHIPLSAKMFEFEAMVAVFCLVLFMKGRIKICSLILSG